MTFVICPNLAIDRMLAADRVRPGGTTRCRALRTQAGGKGANVLRATRALGGDGLLAGFAAGRGGRLIAELADEEGLELEVVVTDGEARVSTVVLGDDGSVTRLYEFGPEVAAADERALLELVARRPAGPGEWAVVTGAAPPGVSPGFYAALVRAARGRRLPDARRRDRRAARRRPRRAPRPRQGQPGGGLLGGRRARDALRRREAGDPGATAGRGPRALPAAARGRSRRRRPDAGRRRRGRHPGRRRVARLDARRQRRQPRRLGRLLRRRPDARAAARGRRGRRAAPRRRGRSRQRGLAVQRRRRPGACGGTGGRSLRRPARPASQRRDRASAEPLRPAAGPAAHIRAQVRPTTQRQSTPHGMSRRTSGRTTGEPRHPCRA